MPYRLAKVEGGYKVKHGDKALSKKPLPRKRAAAQMRAVYASEFKGTIYRKPLG